MELMWCIKKQSCFFQNYNIIVKIITLPEHVPFRDDRLAQSLKQSMESTLLVVLASSPELFSFWIKYFLLSCHYTTTYIYIFVNTAEIYLFSTIYNVDNFKRKYTKIWLRKNKSTVQIILEIRSLFFLWKESSTNIARQNVNCI